MTMRRTDLKRLMSAWLALAVLVISAGQCRIALAAQPAPTIPQDARWTIFCRDFTGPGHMEQALAARDSLLASSKATDWYVVHGADHSTLYFGFYRAIDERVKDKDLARDAAKAASDRAAIRAIVDRSTGRKLFPLAIVMTLDEASPTAPPEWDLVNAKGHWSLQIAAFQDDPRRKSTAIEVVRALRAEGVEAYYYHGPSISSVCVGAFPESAIIDEEAQASDPNTPVLVMPAGLPAPNHPVTADGRPMSVKQPNLKILDPALRELFKKYPTHATNGQEGRKIKTREGKEVEVLDSSFLVVVPSNEARPAALSAPAPSIPAALLQQVGARPPATPADASAPSASRPPASRSASPGSTPSKPSGSSPSAPGSGRLRGLDDF
jgi:hypothetical protein